jgi:hypothetical protein
MATSPGHCSRNPRLIINISVLMEKRISILLYVVFVVGTSEHLPAQQAGARFLLWRPTATSNSMGGVGTAISQDVFASYFNPAGLAFSRQLSIGGSFVRPIPFFGNTAHTFISIAGNVESIGAIAGSANLFWKGKVVRTSSVGPQLIGAEDLFDWQAKLSYARSIAEGVSVGASFGVLRVGLSDIGTDWEKGSGVSTSIMFDTGVMVKDLLPEATWNPYETEEASSFDDFVDPTSYRGMSVGLALLNVGPKMTFIDAAQSDNPPSLLSLGVGYSPIRSNFVGLLIAIDLEKQLFEDSKLDYIHWGGELRLGRFVSLRGGYFQDTFGPKNSYWTFGGGIHSKFVTFNVARYTRTLLPTWHFDGTISLEF